MPEMTRIELLKVFAGTQNAVSLETPTDAYNIQFSIREIDSDSKATETTYRFINESDFEDIKDIFSGILWSLPFTDRLLWILWTREDKFRMVPLREDEKFSFVQSAFTLGNVDINVEKIEMGFDTLWREKYLQKRTVKCSKTGTVTGSSHVKIYPLTWKGKQAAKRLFTKTKDGQWGRIETPPVTSEFDNEAASSVIIDGRFTEPIENTTGTSPPIFIAESRKIPHAKEPGEVVIAEIDPTASKTLANDIAVAVEREKRKVDFLSIAQTDKELEKAQWALLAERGYSPIESARLIYKDTEYENNEAMLRDLSKRISNYLNAEKR